MSDGPTALGVGVPTRFHAELDFRLTRREWAVNLSSGHCVASGFTPDRRKDR
jgi:hypothetical protein